MLVFVEKNSMDVLINLLYTSNICYFIYTIVSSPGLSGWWHVIRVLTSSSKLPEQVRKASFEELLKKKCGPVPLNEDEKTRLRAEYVTLLVIVSSFKDHEFHSPEEMWYSLLTKEEYYNQLLTLNEYALRFLTRTSNECFVESQVSSIENIETSSRHLKHEMGERLSFIKTNGPHPHSSLRVIENALDKHFNGKPWHFVLTDSHYYTSKVVDNKIRQYESMTNDLA